MLSSFEPKLKHDSAKRLHTQTLRCDAEYAADVERTQIIQHPAVQFLQLLLVVVDSSPGKGGQSLGQTLASSAALRPRRDSQGAVGSRRSVEMNVMIVQAWQQFATLSL